MNPGKLPVTNDWQLNCEDIRKRNAYLLNTELWSDCTFVVGPELYSAHRLVLASASPVFEAMFFGGMAEGHAPIVIKDLQHHVFKDLLEYIYTDNIFNKSFDSLCELFYAAKKYMIPSLAQQCSLQIRYNLTTHNVCRAYELATLFEQNDLIAVCTKKISNNTLKIIKEETFEEVELPTMVNIFAMDTLNIDSELDLLTAAERYIRCRGVKRAKSGAPDKVARRENDFNVKTEYDNENHLTEPDITEDMERECIRNVRPAVQQIRFLTMTPAQFADGPASSPLLEPEEAFRLLLCISDPNGSETLPDGFTSSKLVRDKPAHLQPKPTLNPTSHEAKAEATFVYTVHNFKTRKLAIESEIFFVHELPWSLKLVPDELSYPKKLGLYVSCRTTRACHADLTMKLISHKLQCGNHVMSFKYVYNREKVSCGPPALSWDYVCDPTRGLLRSNALTIELHINAEAPRDV